MKGKHGLPAKYFSSIFGKKYQALLFFLSKEARYRSPGIDIARYVIAPSFRQAPEIAGADHSMRGSPRTEYFPGLTLPTKAAPLSSSEKAEAGEGREGSWKRTANWRAFKGGVSVPPRRFGRKRKEPAAPSLSRTLACLRIRLTWGWDFTRAPEPMPRYPHIER